MPTPKIARSTLILGVLLLVVAGASVWWFYVRIPPLVGFGSGNGRLEVQEIDVATKFPGRIAEVLVDEGDSVQVGQVVARMDTSSLNAQVREAEAQVQRARQGQITAKALIAQRRSETLLAERDLERARALYVNANMSAKDYDRARSTMDTAKASTTQAEAQLAEADAAIAASLAQKERIQVDLKDSVLTAPRSGRVQFRLAEPGEVLASGGKVLTLIDPTDVYMTVFLPAAEAGKIALGAQARITLDAAPNLVIPSAVSFVADKAQFTPKEVETRTEREKLMFRIKVKIDPELVKGHEAQVKPGLPGVAYVQLDSSVQWPPFLQTKLIR
ncbi:MAG: HlyD family efflux transporter periplasmic adaptor subunit [Nitrospira sp.]|nr:HlyD family efflux transporter periplasmic adaptor subunit [Nitrospira sp.]MBX3337959.1 HlyD family efflux transporter periplasmic adaptor subunit [Nitrospira sp.]MCW5796243.1 HlyD family efflux transporter periplasmic adaptor subunit [Nitrospira sp.]HNP84312.1 HlyD family efflux transporter periplasmic adaptor subunit [Nitrospira sp.]